jgi:poly(ADP-ribose) glycohydrolase ARH3
VEGESPRYLARKYKNLDQIIEQKTVPEILGGSWEVGRFTDDTQMTLCIMEWLLAGEWEDGRALLERFSRAYHPARRYGSGCSLILETFPERKEQWRALSTIMFPEGSFGNGSAMRAGPVGLFFSKNWRPLISVSETASRTTHSHPRAIVGATLQAAAVALALREDELLEPQLFISRLQGLLVKLRWKTELFSQSLEFIADSLRTQREQTEVIPQLGTGIEASEAVPTAIYCFLANPESYEECLSSAILAGGDTDTIGSMAGAISGAYLGLGAIPKRWLARVKEDRYTVGQAARLASQLFSMSTGPSSQSTS